MSKYKYEKEFMFSIRRLDQIQLFLQSQESQLDLLMIRDNHKNTVIHHTAYHNQPKVLEFYLKYYRKGLQSNNFSFSQIKLHTRLLLDQPNAEGYTAAHYAAYRGNIAVIKVLQKYEAHFGLTNHLKMTMLHLAAEGDKPSTFLYLHDKQLNLNQRDEKMTTPLHWASFAGSQKIVQYLLAQPSVEVNPVDSQGLTPLHLATTYGNSKIVKKLLIAGADRKMKNRKGQTALQIAQSKEFQGITKMLNDEYSVVEKLKIVCNAKTKYQPIKKSYSYPYSFFLLWIIAAGLAFGVTQPSSLLIYIIQGLLMGIVLLLFISLVLQGKKQGRDTNQYSEFAQNNRFYKLCMVCVRQMKGRQHHCPICKTCTPQYDHHCTWINNCVGKHNLARFNILLILIELSLAWITFIALQVILSLANQQQPLYLFSIREWVYELTPIPYSISAVCLLCVLFFAIPLFCLIMVQMKNLLLGKTTYERFSRTKQSILTRQSSLLMNQPEIANKLSLKNCVTMCCDEDQQKKYGEHSSSTTSSFVRET